MARLINPIGNSSRAANAGERLVERCLKKLLEDDYLCWHDVPIGPKRLHPDFVVLHPRRGLLVLEVKDWKLSTLRQLDKHHAELLSDNGAVTRVANPIDQVRQYAHAVVDRLGRDPQLRHHEGNYKGRLCFPYGYGVVLTKITRWELDAALTEHEQDSVLPSRLVICKDEISESADPMEFQERLWCMFEYAFGEPLTLPQIDRIRWHLFPEVRINAMQRNLFERELSPHPNASVPEIVRVMDLEQEQLARSLGSGHRVIHGVAGSGKTLILGYRCLHLAPTAQKPILVLCFNITLAARLRVLIEQSGLAAKVHVHHFHGWCKKQLETYHVSLVESDEENWDRQVTSVIAGVESGWIPRAQYDAVMIDEGHDFKPEWFKLVVQMIEPASDSLLLLYDDAQSIYRKSSGLKFSLSSVGIKAPGRTTILRLNYRNTREICEFAYAFAKAFISPESADEDHIPVIAPESGGKSGHPPVFRRKQSISEEIDFAMKCLRKWHDAGEPLSELAVICGSPAHSRMMQERLQREGLAHLWMGRARSKAAYDPAAEQVSILAIQSSKGLEFNCVILIGVGHLAEAAEAKEQAKLLYVGMTRAREKLILTASGHNPCTEKLEALAA